MPKLSKAAQATLDKFYKTPESQKAHVEGYRAYKKAIKEAKEVCEKTNGTCTLEMIMRMVPDFPQKNPYPFDRRNEKECPYVTEHGAYIEGWCGASTDFFNDGECKRF